MPRPVHFEIHAGDPPRAIAFYQRVFGWKIEQWQDNPYWIVETGDAGPGINGGLLPRQGPAPAPDNPVSASVLTMDVADLDATVQQVLDAGGEPALPKVPLPGMGWLAYCKDTEGNLFGLMQEDPSAG